MSNWLDDYRRRLAATLASKRGGVTTPGMGVSELTRQMAADYTPRRSTGMPRTTEDTGGNLLTELWNSPLGFPIRNTMTLGQKTLDALGTTNYGMANMATEAVEKGEESGIFTLLKALTGDRQAIGEGIVRGVAETKGSPVGLTNPIEDLGAFWRGASHQKHTTFDDYLEAKGRPEGFMRGLEGFAMDVTFDPLTYVGAGAVRAAGRGVAKIPGVAPVVDKARQAVKPRSVTERINLDEYPELRANVEDMPAPTGAPVARTGPDMPPPVGEPTSIRPGFIPEGGTGGTWAPSGDETTRKFLEELADISTRNELGPLADTGRLALPAGPTAAREGMATLAGPSGRPFVAGESGIQSPNFSAAELADLATNAEIERLLSRVPTRRKAPDEDLFFDTRILDPNEPFKVTEKVVGNELVSKRDPSEAVLGEFADRALRDMARTTPDRVILKKPKGYSGPTKNGKVSFRDAGKWAAGNPERIKALREAHQEAAERMARKPSALRKEKIRVFDGDISREITVGDLEKIITRDFATTGVRPSAQRLSLPGEGGKRIPIRDYATNVQAQMRALREDPGNQELRNIIEKTETENWIPVRRRFPKGSQQLANWRRRMEEAGFSREEINALNRNANLSEAAYRALFQRIVDRKITQKYDLDSLEAALKSKTVDAADIKPLLDLLGVKTIRGARSRIDKLQERLRGISDRTAPTMERGSLFDELDARSSKPGTAEYDVRNAKGEVATNPTAADFVDEALDIGEDLSSPVGTIAREQAEAVSDTLAQFNSRLQKIKKDWKFKSGRGAHRSSPTPGEGQAAFIHGFNAKDQYTVANSLIKNLRDQYGKDAWHSMPADRRVGVFLSSLKATEDTLKARGFFPILGTGAKGKPLSMHDILSTLPRATVHQHVLQFQTAQAAENWLNFAKVMLDDIDNMVKPTDEILEELENIALKPMVRYTKEGKKTIQSNFGKAAVKSGDKRAYAREHMVQPMLKIAGKLDNLYKKNMAEYLIGEGKAVRQATDEIIENFNRDITNGAVAESVHRMVRLSRESADTIKKNKKDGFADAPSRVEEQVKVELDQIADSGMMHVAGKTAQANAKAATKADRVKAANSQTSAIAAADRDLFRDAIVRGDLEDFNLQQELEFGLFSRFVRPLAPHMANGDLRPWLIGERNAAQGIAMRYTAGLNMLAKKHTNERLAEVFRYYQNPVEDISKLDTASLEALDDIKKAGDFLFTHKAEDAPFAFFQREGFTIDQVNRMLSHNGLHEKFRFKNNLEEWREWDIGDPLDFLSKMEASAQHLSALKAVGQKFTQHFGHEKPIIGRKMVRIKRGYARNLSKNVRGSERQDSWVFDFIDDGKFYDREIAEQLSVLDKAITEMYIPASRSKFLRGYDTVLHSTKAGYTIYRLGHHMRNAVGDAWLNWMIGVKSRDYTKGARALAVAKGQYRDFDFTAFLAGMGELPVARGDEILTTLNVGGRQVKISAAQYNRAMHRHGALPDHNIIEDTGFNSPISGLAGELGLKNEKAQRGLRPFGGRVRKAATSFSEVRDHMFRAPQFIREVERLKPRTHFPNGKRMTDDEILEDLFDRAGAAVRKHHPDGSDLTQFERTVARRTFTFYSWARKAIPLVMEHILMRPGRFMVYPKAMYNIAEGQGIDLNGYGDPFPSDQLFPDFLRESVQGPVAKIGGSYIGVKPGTPGVDILDEYFGTPYETLLNSVVPFVRVPIELGTGHKPGGVPIMDKSDYLGQQIPNMSYADRAANTLFGATVSSGFTDPLYTSKSNEGYEDPLTAMGLLNWLGGMGVTDMSKPSYQKAAEYDIRDRIREARGR